MAKPDSKRDSEQGVRQVAALLLGLDGEAASVLLRQLGDGEVQLLTAEMARLGQLSGEELDSALRAFGDALRTDAVDASLATRRLVEKAFGRERGRDLIDRAGRGVVGAKPFGFLHGFPAKDLGKLLASEHVQVQALVLTHVDAPVAAEVLGTMADDLRFDLVRRMASSEGLSGEAMRRIEAAIERRVRALPPPPAADDIKQRFKAVAQMLTAGKPEVSKPIIEKMAAEIPDETNEIQALMFVIDDIMRISDKDMQKVLSEVDKGDLVLALKAIPQEIADKILGNLSSRARDNIKEEIEMLGPKPLAEVEEAQKRLLQAVRAMEERGDIKVNRGGGGETLV